MLNLHIGVISFSHLIQSSASDLTRCHPSSGITMYHPVWLIRASWP